MALLERNINIFSSVIKNAGEEEDEKVYEQLGIKQNEEGKIDLQPGWKFENGVLVPPKDTYSEWEWPEETAIDFKAQTIKNIQEQKERDHAAHISKLKSRYIKDRKPPNDDPVYKQIIEQKLKEQKERDAKVETVTQTQVISDKDKQALHELENHFTINRLASKVLFEKYEGGKNIVKQEMPLVPRNSNSELKAGDVYIVATTAQASGLRPETIGLSLRGDFNTSPNGQKTIQKLENMSFTDAAALVLKTLPEYEFSRIDKKNKEKAPVHKRTLLPEVSISKKGPNTIMAALKFPARQFPVNHPQMGKLRTSFDEKLIGIRISRQHKAASNLFLDVLKTIQAAGFKPIYKQKPTNLTPEEKQKLQEKAKRNLKKPEEKFDVYITTDFDSAGEAKNELYLGAILAVDPEDALNQIVRVSGGTEGTGYSKLLERAFRLAHKLEKPLVTPKQMAEHRENLLTERDTPAKGTRKDKEEALESFLESKEQLPANIKERMKKDRGQAHKSQIKQWKNEPLDKWNK